MYDRADVEDVLPTSFGQVWRDNTKLVGVLTLLCTVLYI